MRKAPWVITLAFAPVALLAQGSSATATARDTTKAGMSSVAKGHGQTVSASAKDSGSASATAKGHGQTVSAAAHADARADASLKAPKGWSAEGTTRLEAMYADAKKRDIPPQPMAKRVAEGSAKGASETTILVEAGKVKANLEASQEAMVQAGRKPTQDETERGATAMEHGVTQAELKAMAEHTPSDRSLVVAFDVLSKLAARGVPVAQALAEVQAKIDARASDSAIIALGGKGPVVNGNGNGSANGAAATSAAGGAAAGAGASAAGAVTGTAKGVTGSVTGAVTGVVKKP
jgi:hypothetical protein